MRPIDTRALLREGTLDGELAALLWLLVEGGVSVVVTGSADRDTRSAVAAAILSIDPAREWLVLDADETSVTAEQLAALLRGGAAFALTVSALDLEDLLERLLEQGLPEDGVRRLGVVVIAEATEAGLRLPVAHYLRPTERDAQGHVQRRPPAVLAAWDGAADAYEHYAWGITPELADRVDRAQADLEDRQRERAAFLVAASAGSVVDDEFAERVAEYLASEPARTPAPKHPEATPSPFRSGLTDPEPHRH